MRGYILDRSCDESAVLPERIAHSAADISGMALNEADAAALGWPLSNVWLGTSAEDQPTADERVPHLLATPAAVRWISAEPLLGPITLRKIRLAGSVSTLDALAGGSGHIEDAGWPALDWVVAGGESGPRARPMDPEWARSLRDQCQATAVPFLGRDARRSARHAARGPRHECGISPSSRFGRRSDLPGPFVQLALRGLRQRAEGGAAPRTAEAGLQALPEPPLSRGTVRLAGRVRPPRCGAAQPRIPVAVAAQCLGGAVGQSAEPPGAHSAVRSRSCAVPTSRRPR